MAENEPVKVPATAIEVPPEAIATPPSFVPERETPEAAELREAEGLPPLPPLKYNHKPAAKAAGEAHAARKDQPAARK